MLQSIRPVLLLVSVCVLPALAEEVVAPATAEDALAGATRWLQRQAVPVPNTDAVEWPEYAETPEERAAKLYDGAAGVLVFLENAAVLLEDAALAELADRTARGLETAQESGDGLYTGVAGHGAALVVRGRLRGFEGDEWSEAASTFAAVGVEPDARGSLDIIAGTAGTILALLDWRQVAPEPSDDLDARIRKLALDLARAGRGQGEARWWPARTSSDRHYPNFSHGTAGVAYALARVVLELPGDHTEIAAAARAGGRWMLENAHVEGETMCWYHSSPRGETRFMEGWCHGPAGTVRALLLLGLLEGEDADRYLDAALRSARWVMEKRPSPDEPGKTRFYSPSLCCGAAGVIDLFVDLYHCTGDETYADYARGVGAYLTRLAKPEGDGCRWTNYDRPDDEGVIYHGTSLMLGAAGEALALLRLRELDDGGPRVVQLPDRWLPFEALRERFVEFDRPDAPATPPAASPEGWLETTVRYPAGLAHAGDAYVVITTATDPDDPLMVAAMELARWRKGALLTGYDPETPAELVPALRRLGARHVAIVLPVEHLHTNTHRTFLMAACTLDADPFPDVAFGYLTTVGKTTALNLVERARRLEVRGLPKRWVGNAVASSIESTIYPGAADPTAARAGYEGFRIYWGSRESDPDVLDFVDAHLHDLAGGGVVQFSGCGDPEGVWLFSDRRNADRSKHWDYDPAKVGYDPEGEMPRLTAARMTGLDLSDSIVWSGVCHTASLDRVFVEGDIVSTFGRVPDHFAEYRIPGGRSVAGAILDAGAAALMAPAGPNHGYRQLMEAQAALEGRLSLGDVLRSTYCDVAFALSDGGKPFALDLYAPGQAVDVGMQRVMAGGCANRLLIGDPALAPFQDYVEPTFEIELEELSEHELAVRVETKHKDWWSWSMMAGDQNRERLQVSVVLPAHFPVELVRGRAWGSDGSLLELGRIDALVEYVDGQEILHLQLGAPRETGLGVAGVKAEFRLPRRRIGWSTPREF